MKQKKSYIHAHFGLHVSGYHKHGTEEKRKMQKISSRKTSKKKTNEKNQTYIREEINICNGETGFEVVKSVSIVAIRIK